MLSTTQKKKCANVIRVFLADNDRTLTSTMSNPQFTVNLEPFYDAFDQTRPIYCSLENFVCSTSPATYTYALCWNNMPVWGRQFSTVYSASKSPFFVNCLAVMSQYGTTACNKLTTDTLGIPININQLMSNNIWEFSILKNNGAQIGQSDLGTYMFVLAFWQRAEDATS